jgi:biopolymer transport protein ExbD
MVLSIAANGLVYIKERPVHPSKLLEVLTPLVRGRSEEIVFLKGDRDVPYGQVIEVLNILNQGGIVKVGMVTDRPDKK